MGQKILNYDVIARLGEGAGSVIYAVIDPATSNIYALKHVVREDAKDIRFVEQMQQEFEISRQFDHPNLRKIYELKINKKMMVKVTEAFLLMELVDGKAIDVQPPRDIIQAIDTFIQAAKGLQFMHNLGFVHCDIKPNNIMRTDDGMVKVIDFGQSCKFGTIKERIQGTPDYIAPEQVHRRPVSHKTDIFNLGATIYWTMTRRNIPTLYTAGRGDNSFVVAERVPSPNEINPQVPVSLSNLVMDCITPKPEKRPANMENVIGRLELTMHQIMHQQNPQKTPAGEHNIDDHE